MDFYIKFEKEMNRFICALWNEAVELSQKRGKQPLTVGNSHCSGEVHAS